MGTGVEARERMQDVNRNGSGDGAGMGTGAGMRERTQGTKTGAGTETRAVAGTGTETETGTGTGSETGKGTIMRRRGEEGESFGIRHVRKEANKNSSLCHFACAVDRRWRLQVASIFWRGARRLPVYVAPRREQGTRDGREKMVTGTGTGAGTGTSTSTAMSTRTRMGLRTGTGMGTRAEMRVEGGGKREPGNLRSGDIDGSEDVRVGAMPKSNKQPLPQDSTP